MPRGVFTRPAWRNVRRDTGTGHAEGVTGMYDVNLYIGDTGNGDFKNQWREYWYVMECILRGGREHKVEGWGRRENETEWGIALAAMAEALGRMAHPGRIHLYTKCRVFRRPSWQENLREWKANGFLKAGGEPVKNREMWERVGELMENHCIIMEPVDELEKAEDAARSLDPDPWKRPQGLEKVGYGARKAGDRMILYTYYVDRNMENEEFRYRYDSGQIKCAEKAG